MADDTDDSENTDLEVEQEENDGEPQLPIAATPRTALPVVTADQNQAPAARNWAPAPGAQPVSAAPYLRAPGPVPGQQLNKEWAPAPGAQPVSIATTYPQKTDKGVSLKDYGKVAWASALEGGAGLAAAASFAARKIIEDPEIVGFIEKQRHALADSAASWIASTSPGMQLAARASLFGGGNDENGNHVPSPGEVGWARYAGATLASFVPDAVMLVVPGGVVGKFVEKVATKAIGTAARVGTTGTLFGGQQAGEAYSSLVDQVDHAKPDEMMGSPVYAHARQQGMSDLDAKRLVVEKFTPYFAAQFGVGAVSGAGAGGLLTRGAMGAAGASVGRRAAIGAAEGAGTMGVQAGAGNALQQDASQDAGLQKEFDPHKMAQSFASGALGGALLGAVGGAAHRGARPRTTEEEPQPEQATTLALPPPDHMQPEQHAALSETLALPKPETIYGPETPWTSTGEGMIPGRGSFTARPSDGVTPTPAPEPQQRLLPKPQTGYGEGFTMPPEGTPAVPLDKQLPAPEQRSAGALPPPDLGRGVQGDQFTVSRQEPGEPARPSGGMNRGNLVDALVKQGQDAQKLRRMKIGELRDAYDQAQTPPEAARQQFRPGVGEVPLPSDHPVDKAAAAASEPSEAQKEAGNYQKGHVSIQGLDISIENPKGSTRKGPVDKATGKPAWEAEMPAHYGYIRGTIGGDGEHVDVHLGPRTKALFDGKPADAAREPVYVVDQIDPTTGKFDEHKALLGFHTGIEATRAYDAGFTDGSGPSRRGHVSEMTFPEFKEWLRNSDTTKPVAYKKPTVGEQLKAKRATEKQRMAEPMMSLLKRDQVKPRVPETKIEEEPEENGARAEVENQPVRYESDRSAPATVVEQPAPKPRSPKSTDKTRQLKDLEDMVVDGTLTATEADKEYGRNERTAGRDRRYEDFASWLRDRIKEAEDPKTTQDLLTKAERLQNDKSLVGAKKIAASREINEALQRTDPEHIQKLKDALADLEDPVKAAADRAERKAKGAAALDKIKALRDKKLEPKKMPAFAADSRITKAVRDLLESSHAEGKPRTVHDYLDAIVNDQVLRVRQPQYVALARRLKELVPADVEVMSQEIAEATRQPPHTGTFIDDDHIGTFYASPDAASWGRDLITLNRTGGRMVETLLHEATHAATIRYVDDIAPNHPDRLALNAITKELQDAGNKREMSDSQHASVEYALSDPAELVTMLMTNPEAQRFAAEVTPSPEFRQKMAELGYKQPARSLWQAFTRWVRRIVGLPEGTSDSLLDHVLQPLQNIIEKGAEYNRLILGVDEQIRRAADPLADASRHAFPRLDRDTAREALDRIDPKGLSDRGRRSVLQGATTDGIVNWNRELFKTTAGDLLENYRTATEAMAARAKDFRDEWTDKIHGLLGRTSKLGGDDRAKLAQLMNDATINEAALGTNAQNANNHLAKPDQQKALSALQARYNGLSREAKILYNSFRDFYRQSYDTEREAQLSGLIKTALPEATPAQVAELTKSVKTMRGIRQLVDDPDASPVAAAFADAWDRNRSLVRLVAKVHSQGFVRGDYFPLRRFGDYVVHYGDKGAEDYGVEMFDRRSQAEARRAELLKQGVEPSQVLDRRTSRLREMVPTTVMDELHSAVAHSTGFTDEQAHAVRDMFASVLMQHASRSEAARTRLRRQGVQGASTDVERVMARDFLSLASRLGYLEHGPDRANALAAMRRHSDYLGRNGEAGEQIRAQAVVHELELRQPSGDDATGALTGLSRKFSTLGYVYSLMSPSHMLTSTIEAHMNSSSLLGARHGFARAGLALSRALRETAPIMTAAGVKNTLKAVGKGLQAADWNLSHVIRDRLIAGGANRAHMNDLFGRLNNAGLVDHSMVRELQRIANPGADITKGWWGKFMDMNAAMAHAVDVANKSAIAKAAYDLEFGKTKNHDQAAKYAVEMARQVMPNYNLANKARISTDKGILGGMAAPLTQFKQYGIHMYSMMGNLLKASIHGASRQDRMEARKAFAAILATHALMAGSLTLIGDPLRYVMGAYDYITGAERPHDYQNDVRAWIADAFGPELGEVISRGVPHAAGFDIHRRVGLANLLEVPELKSFDKAGFTEMLVAAMTGAAGQDATEMAGAVHKILDGDLASGIKGLVPRVVRDPMKAYALSSQGVTDSKGKPILPASKVSNLDVAYQAAGFQPSRVSEFREARNAVLEAREEDKSERGKILTAFVTAAPSDRRDILVDVQSYNRTHPGSPITYSQLLQAVKRQADRVQSPKTLGLQLPKKTARSLSEHGSFANVQ